MGILWTEYGGQIPHKNGHEFQISSAMKDIRGASSLCIWHVLGLEYSRLDCMYQVVRSTPTERSLVQM